MSTESPHDGAPPARKAVLFCPDCSHESPVDGDWRTDRTGGECHVRCPDCGTTITSRPAETDRSASPVFALSPASSLLGSTELVADAWRRYTTQVTTLIK